MLLAQFREAAGQHGGVVARLHGWSVAPALLGRRADDACRNARRRRYTGRSMSIVSATTVPDRKQAHEAARLAKRLRHAVGRAIADYGLIEDGDRVMVCLSGGKDSWTLLDLLLSLQAKAPVRFDLVAVNLDQKQPGFPGQVIPDYCRERGVPFRVIEQDTYSVVTRVVPQGKTMCSLCSRLRRGALYAFSEREGFTKIALGHHRDDILATFFLNLFHGGTLKAMPPKLLSDDGRHIVIRPLAWCRELDIAEYAAQRRFPIIPCNLCGSQDNLQRKQIRYMLDAWEREHPGRSEIMFRALCHVAPSQLADPGLFDFGSLGSRSETSRPDPHAWLGGGARDE
jgi:tRNA 2-thiocytidine biosynthesis protein TtcA